MNNERNIKNYRWLSKVYDFFVQNRWFEKARKREFDLADIQDDQNVLIVGIGTGLDLRYLSTKVKITGVDLSSEMLELAKEKGKAHHLQLFKMPAEQLNFPDKHFDVIIMNLILSVVENPQLAIKEAHRVLKSGGSIWILDKFVEDDHPISLSRRLLNKVTSAIATDITRSLIEIIAHVPLVVSYKESAFWGSTFQIIQLKPTDEMEKQNSC